MWYFFLHSPHANTHTLRIRIDLLVLYAHTRATLAMLIWGWHPKGTVLRQDEKAYLLMAGGPGLLRFGDSFVFTYSKHIASIRSRVSNIHVVVSFYVAAFVRTIRWESFFSLSWRTVYPQHYDFAQEMFLLQVSFGWQTVDYFQDDCGCFHARGIISLNRIAYSYFERWEHYVA